MDDTIEFNPKGLNRIIKALKGPLPTVRVGILGTKTQRNDTNQTNATIGACHEFGTTNMVARSWLRIPLIENLQSYLEKSRALDKDTLVKMVNTGSIKEWMAKIGIVAEAVISDGFSTSGFGKWANWKDPNYHNQANQILVDTQQLRNSISSDVVE